MNFGLHVPNFGSLADPGALADLAAEAEAAGWAGCFLWDHVARGEGDFPMVEPWVTLAAMAAATDRIRLGPLVTPLARRRPWNVAREVVTLDHLSGGRVVLGVGLGVSRGPEFAAFGEERDERARGDRLDEGIAILRAAWSGEPVTHDGIYHLDGVAFLPRPLQASIPLWAATERVDGRPVRRAAGLGGVFPFGLRPADAPALLANVALHRPGGLDGYDLVAAGIDDWAEWRKAGATWWLRVLPWREPLIVAQELVRRGPPRS